MIKIAYTLLTPMILLFLKKVNELTFCFFFFGLTLNFRKRKISGLKWHFETKRTKVIFSDMKFFDLIKEITKIICKNFPCDIKE